MKDGVKMPKKEHTIADRDRRRLGEVRRRVEARVDVGAGGDHGLPERKSVARLEGEIVREGGDTESEGRDRVHVREDVRLRLAVLQRANLFDGQLGRVGELAERVESLMAVVASVRESSSDLTLGGARTAR